MILRKEDGTKLFSLTKKELEMVEQCKYKISEHVDDMVLGIFWGDVGCGKSVKAMHWAYAIDPTIDSSRICFDKEEFITAVVKNRKKVIIGDEGISLFHNRAMMTKEGRVISEIMDQVRQKNLCIFICIPDLLSVDKRILQKANFVCYVWEGRTKHIQYEGELLTKGNVAIYPKLPGKDYKQMIITYLKLKDSGRKANLPPYWASVMGKRLINGAKKPFYPGGMCKYLEKKESILDKYIKKPKDVSKEEMEGYTATRRVFQPLVGRDSIKIA